MYASSAIAARWLSVSDPGGAAEGDLDGGREWTPEALDDEWTELLAALPNVDEDRIHAALLGGVPDAKRPRVWLEFSGAAQAMAARPTLYADLLEQVAASSASGRVETAVHSQIENDLRRTQVDRSARGASSRGERAGGSRSGGEGSGGEGTGGEGDESEALGALRRVLRAFAAFSPSVSYVQGPRSPPLPLLPMTAPALSLAAPAPRAASAQA